MMRVSMSTASYSEQLLFNFNQGLGAFGSPPLLRNFMSYRPDPSFVKKLKYLDPRLDCHFDNRRKLVVVTYKRATGEPLPIYTVQTEDGEFRLPDMRDIEAIQEGDMSRQDLSDRLAKHAKYQWDYRRDQKRARELEMKERTADDKYQLARTLAHRSGASGKVGQHLPKWDHKPKGKVF